MNLRINFCEHASLKGPTFNSLVNYNYSKVCFPFSLNVESTHEKKMTRQNTFYERNKHTIEKSSNPTGLVCYTNIAAVSLLPIWLP